MNERKQMTKIELKAEAYRNYVDSIMELAKEKSRNDCQANVEYAYVAGFMSADLYCMLVELELTSKQMKVLAGRQSSNEKDLSLTSACNNSEA